MDEHNLFKVVIGRYLWISNVIFANPLSSYMVVCVNRVSPHPQDSHFGFSILSLEI